MNTEVLPLSFYAARRRECFFGAPTGLYSERYRRWTHSNFSRPLCYGLGSTIKREIDVFFQIVGLCFSIRPTTIFRRVTSIIVDSIKSRAFRSWPHIGEKGVERIHPAFANGYASTPIAVKMSTVRVGASGLHGFPRAILGRVNHFVPTNNIYMEASARLGVPRSEAGAGNDNSITAIAEAEPFWVAGFGVFRSGDNGKSVELLTRKLDKCAHFITSIMVNNHWKERSNRVIEFPLSSAKTSYASTL